MSDTDEKAPKKNVLKSVLALFRDANDWVQKAVGDDEARCSILMDLGLPTALPAGTPPKAYPQSDLPGINKYRQQEEPDATAFLEAVADIKTMYEAGRAFVRAYQESEGGNNEALLDEIAHRFFELIALNFLRNHCPALYWPARALGFIEETLSLHGSGKTYPERLSSFFRDVGGHFKQIGGGLDNHAEAEAWTDTVLSLLAVALAFAKSDWLSAGVNHMFYGWDPTPNSPTPLADKVSSRAVSFAYEGKTASFVLVPREHGGPGILLAVGGTFAFDLPLPGDWDLHVEVSAPAALDLLVRFDRLDATPDASRPKVQFALRKRSAPKAPAASTRSLSVPGATPTTTTPEAPAVIGVNKGTHLEFGPMTLAVQLDSAGMGVSLAFADSALVLQDGDSFTAEALSSSNSRLPFQFGVGWKSGGGLYFEGGGGSGLRLLIPVAKTLGRARLQSLALTLEPVAQADRKALALETTAAIDVNLGPLKASIDRVGFRMLLDFSAPQKNLGFADLTFGFRPPSGVGIAVDSAVVKGGGFLYLDAAAGQYAGVAHLEIHDMISVKALGLLNTKLPDGSKGYSLLLIVTAEGFRPIPLGFGFMLTGIGGLLGVHRTANTAALQAGVRNRSLDAVLFPKNLIANAPQYLSTLSTVFPPARDHFLVGLAAQITWGTPTLVTINLALILEFGSATKLLILGQLAALLPNPKNDLVRLHIDAVGIIDFDQRTASLDARLYDSHLARQFAISGDMAMRMRWGQQPSFALAVGGFHPAFTPPAGFPALERATINLANSEHLQIRCEAYLAITSNTVQFGSRSELLVKAGGVSLHGEIGYDVLIQFDPFHFIADFRASVQIKYKGHNLLRVALRGELSGPRPMRVRGKATFEILWFDVSVSFDRTLIAGAAPPAPAPVDVLPHLQEALRQPANWQIALPSARLVTLRESAAPGAVTLHPLSTLGVRQNVVPLNLHLTRFGNSRPSQAQAFRVQQAAMGGQPVTLHSEPLRDFFAPAQFRDMSDDEKLSAPAFESLPAGVQFSSGSLRYGTAMVANVDEYDEYISPQPAVAGAPSAPAAMPHPDLLARFGHLSAVGSSAVQRTGRNKYQAKPMAMASTEKAYAIASRGDPTASTARYRTWTEASAALWQIRHTSPAQARELQIVTL